jgi:hypothetical protein
MWKCEFCDGHGVLGRTRASHTWGGPDANNVPSISFFLARPKVKLARTRPRTM